MAEQSVLKHSLFEKTKLKNKNERKIEIHNINNNIKIVI